MAIANLIRLAVWRTLLGDSYNAKLVCFGEGTMKLCTHEKAGFSSCKYTHGVVAGFLGHTTDYRVS